MNFDNTHSFYKNQRIFNTFRPLCSYYHLLVNPGEIFDCWWTSLEQQWEPRIFFALGKIAYNSDINLYFAMVRGKNNYF